MNNADNSQEI